jgi:hypothetical protein
MLIERRPVYPITAATDFPTFQIRSAGLEQAWKPSERHADGTAVNQSHCHGIAGEFDILYALVTD